MSGALADPSILAALQPTEYYKKWMAQRFPTRPDQRNTHQFRPISIHPNTVGTADASCTVLLGGTTIVGAIKLEVTEPTLSAPEEGYLVINVTFCAGCSPSVRAGPPTDRAQELTSKISSIAKNIELLQPDALCIIPGKLVWVVHLDLFVMNDCGNLFDALWMALLVSLRNVHLPTVRMNDETGIIYYDPKSGSTLNMNLLPLPLSFSYLPEQDSLIADPDDREEVVLQGASIEVLIDYETKAIVHSESFMIPLQAALRYLQEDSTTKRLDELKSLL